MQSDETVADVLYEISDEETPEPLYDLTRGAIGREELDYEDWVRPMKLTGGRVCLRVDPDDRTGVGYYTVESDTLVYMTPDARTKTNAAAIGLFKGDMACGWIDLQPVLREDTPFGEED